MPWSEASGSPTPGAAQVLGVKVENAGSTACAVKDVRVLDAGGGVCSVPGGELEGLVLGPTDSFSFMVGFTAPPGVQGAWTGRVGFAQVNPAEPLRTVPLRAQVGAPCVAWTPAYLDVGLSRPDCPAPEVEARLENRCAVPRTVRAVRLRPGTTDGEFELLAAPAFPLLLAPGVAAPVRVRYRGQVPGMNLAPLLAEVEGELLPLEATLVDESSPHGRQVDRWVQADARKMDVLLVVDNTASMVEEHPRWWLPCPRWWRGSSSAAWTSTWASPPPVCSRQGRGVPAGRRGARRDACFRWTAASRAGWRGARQTRPARSSGWPRWGGARRWSGEWRRCSGPCPPRSWTARMIPGRRSRWTETRASSGRTPPWRSWWSRTRTTIRPVRWRAMRASSPG
ncbi:MAG: hypothetical protein FJ086_10725 [Deltaproteobacteria bacterium]|nr:hypothetical protein [Deltaproteobacteria bacterium]